MLSDLSLADRVAELLRQQIAEGVYKIGDKLPTEPELMKIFEVGRSSIREAVKLLVNMGVVRVQQGSGTFVAETSDANGGNINMSIADRTELDEVRKILDIAIVEKAVARRTERDIERMRSTLEAVSYTHLAVVILRKSRRVFFIGQEHFNCNNMQI